MTRPARLAALGLTGLAGLALAPLTAPAQSPSVTMTSPFHPTATGSPLPSALYWSTPYWAHPYRSSKSTPYAAPSIAGYPASGTNSPAQFGNPANPFSIAGGEQVCVAAGTTCAASVPNIPGQPCTCPAGQGETVTGIVHGHARVSRAWFAS
ncbi:MAG: hypothetical protein ABI369_02840 [Acetobacteraceae bacterium]